MLASSAAKKQTIRRAAASSSSASPASRKRKADPNAQKFYAVRSGHKPGIYLTWPECQAQIAGFKGAQFKSFFTREDAAAFIAGKTPPSEVGDEPDKFYAVAKGRRPGVYTNWETASEAIKGTKGPKYKRFGTRAEAEAFIRLYGNAETVLAMEGVGLDDDDDDDDEDEESEADDDDDEEEEEEEEEEELHVAKKIKTGATTSVSASSTGQLLRIYTDGSSRNNGYYGAAAGVGVFFGPNDPRNISERLQGEPQTNQRAELTAVLRALETVPVRQGVQIVTDSKYSIQCVTEWYSNWEKNGWMTRQGPVKNRDLVQAIRAKIGEREARGTQSVFTWVKGHATDPGNIAADNLAVQGSRAR